MTNEQICEKAMELILSAGQSKTHSMQAINYARKYEFKEAEDELQKAGSAFIGAHEIQNELISSVETGENVLNILMVHAQDHLTMALMAKENATELIEIYKKLKYLEEK